MTRSAHPKERAVGIEWYTSTAEGTGGRLRSSPADFQVREIETIDPEPVEADPDAYPHLVVRAKLENWDTHGFATVLSNAMGISRERVRWAGTKDARAVTTQLFSLDVAEPDLPDIDGADLVAVGRFGRPISLGDLAGNAFDVVVREPERPRALEAITTELAIDDGRIGVANFFGQQRFGSHRPITHTVGLAVVREDWEGAVMTYLGESFPDEPATTRAAREYVSETRDWAGGLERMPGHLRYERSMLHALVAAPGDFRGALEELPESLQRLFVHAAQSFVFNRILSERLERGLPLDRPIAGDVVCVAGDETVEGTPVPDTDRTQVVDDRRLETVKRHCERQRAFVTGPLVGTETTLADGRQGAIEREVLAEVGLEPNDFDLPDPFHSSGTRRALFLQTALETDRDPLRFRFSLPRGAYATVVLREYLKVDPVAMS